MRETRQSFQQKLQEVVAAQQAEASPGQTQLLTRFDLDFPGGTPGALAEAIEKASGKPLNLVIPIGSAQTPLPPLKMRGDEQQVLVVRPPNPDSQVAGLIHTRALEPAFVVATQPSLTRVINTESPAIDIVQTDPNLQLYHEINDDQLLLPFAGGSTALTRSGHGDAQFLFLDKATGSGTPMH
ncbi:MAG: hypothetical protein AB9869_20060 [Verrucomicrobiia bacterium]